MTDRFTGAAIEDRSPQQIRSQCRLYEPTKIQPVIPKSLRPLNRYPQSDTVSNKEVHTGNHVYGGEDSSVTTLTHAIGSQSSMQSESHVHRNLELVRFPDIATVDIVFVPGALPYPREAWCDASTGTDWLADPAFWEYSEMRNARVFKFCYHYKRLKRINDVSSIARELKQALWFLTDARPLLLVAHSLGGLVVQALLNLPDGSASNRFTDKVAGMVFFSVPYGKKYTVDQIRHLAQIDSVAPVFTQESLDSMLSGCGDKFRKTAIKTFYETDPTQGLKVGGHWTCITGMPTEDAKPLPATNHYDICNFTDANSTNYKLVRQGISDLIYNASYCEHPPTKH